MAVRARPGGRRRATVAVAVFTAATVTTLALAATARPARAAGIVTHAWMAEEAVDLVGDPALAGLLHRQRDQLRAGAAFPDGGYFTRDAGIPGGDYGEEAHWQRFHDAYLAVLRARPDCGDRRRPDGPCAPHIAHLLGVAAHGVGDQVWDWLFEPAATDHGELWIPPELADRLRPGGIEVQMDVVAIADHGRPTAPAVPEPAPDDLVAAFAAAGQPGITPEALAEGRRSLDTLRSLEAAGAPGYREAVHAHMPWTASHLVTAPGGVRGAARAIAAVYEVLWARLLGGDPPTTVSVTAPADGSVDVPAAGWVRDYRPGAWPDGGGARTRIAAVLSSGLPYVAPDAPPGTDVDPQLPAGAAVLTERDTGRVVPLLDGYPRIVPHDPDRGAHIVAVQPATDLAPCTWYRVSTTDRLRDGRGRAVAPATWTFRTEGCPASPAPGPDGPAGDGATPVDPPSTDRKEGVRSHTTRTVPPIPVPVRASPRYVG